MHSYLTEHRVAKTGELQPNEMKEVTVGQTRILLARVDDTIHAFSAICTHYGAPLVEGFLYDGRVTCPWHHACFNVRTGSLEEPPAIDSLACFDVTVEGEDVIVHLPVAPLDRVTPPMSRRDPDSSALAAIIGAGAAGYTAAQTLREDGFTGRVVMITRDNQLPYDRPNLSKDYLHGHADPEWMPLRPDEFFANHDIEVMLDTEVAHVDTFGHTITFADGSMLDYDSLLVATGGTPRRIEIPGADLDNIFVLRSFSDADAIIRSAQPSSRAVVIGTSFIGMEAACSLKKRGLDVTVVGPEPVPFSKTLGHEIGTLFQKLHEENGVSFRPGTTASRFEGTTSVESVVLENGERLTVDLVIVGIGVDPATGFLDGILPGSGGSVSVDSHLRATDGVYAAGDIASYPDPRTGLPTRIEHWRTAQQQGRVAGHNMAGRMETFDGVPFFWTEQFDQSLRYIGHTREWDEIIWHGDVSSRTFLAFYVKNDRVVAVAGMKRDRDMAALEELMRLDRVPTPDELREGPMDFPKILNDIA